MAAICRNHGRRLIFHSDRTLSLFFSSSSSTSSPSPSPLPPFRAVKSAIESESDPLKLVSTFESSSSSASARFLRHRPLLKTSVHKLARSGRPDLVERILNHTITTTATKSSSLLSSEGFWIRFVMLYSSAQMVGHAVRTFDQMAHHDCPRTEKSLCAILSVHLDNEMYDELHQIFASVPLKIGVTPGVKSYNLVLKAFCKEKKVNLALELFHKMENEGKVMPDTHSCNLLLDALLENNDEAGFDAVVKKMLDKGLEPDVMTYNLRIRRLCRSKECVRAKKLLDEMVSKGVKPNPTSYNALILGFCKVGDLESGRKVLERMLGEGGYVSPPSSSYYMLMRHMVEEGEFDSALEICKEIIKRKWVPPFEAMEGLVNGLVKMSKSNEAKEVVEKMKKRLRGGAVDSWGKIEAALPL